ncbi:YggS family pyridoxal phosphate-dependent enzyme [Nitrincola sp. MINF-07-Sa-05]|uniref:YggS family pyridoxal phosphate-dependent enzyme n=1 Tax=Nitrincola salilacus TaxID=3400273 RepID=UPI003917C7F1
MMSIIAEKVSEVRQEISRCEQLAVREPGSVTLLAVSKTRKSVELREAYDAGQRLFGENYLQEAQQKMQELSDLPLEWHFIGPIQSNKTRPIAEAFDWVHSVDRLKIAQRLSEQRPADKDDLNICLQVNISHEANKSGCSEVEASALAEQIASLPHLCLRGLMAIPEATDDPAEQRQAFARMRELFEKIRERVPTLDTLSMGMSGDLEAAIMEGSTMVRIGTALFGPRPASNL